LSFNGLLKISGRRQGMSKQVLIGAHESISKGLYKSIERLESVGGNCLQIFTKSSRAWAAKPLQEKEIEEFKKARVESGVKDVVAHDSYLINLCSERPQIVQKSLQALKNELIRTHQLGISYLVMHPGSHQNQGEGAGLQMIADNINRIFFETPESSGVQLLLETTAGQGTNLGWRFEHLAEIIGRIKDKSRVGVCFDFCHAFCAGYDLRTEDAYEKTFEEFERVIGLQRLKAIHVNDSKHGLGSRKDRHEHIGKGHLGRDAFALLMNDSRFADIPKILETDKSEDLHEDKENIDFLLSLVKD